LKTPCRIQLKIDLKKVLKNINTMQSQIGDCQLIPVLKADAYGLGAIQIGKYLAENGISQIGLADVNEAIELKGLFSEIHLLGDVFESELKTIIEKGWICPVSSISRLKEWEQYCRDTKLKIQFNIDTGMGQTGIPIKIAQQEILEVMNLPWIEIKGIYSHFTNAESAEDDFALQQMKEFKALINDLENNGLKLPFKHIGNSNGINFLPESYKEFSHVRSGINLYGIQESQTSKNGYLAETLELKTSVIKVNDFKPGESLGYGREFIVKNSMKIATIPIGYADGIPYQSYKEGYVLINECKCPIVGRLSMDYTSVDVSNVPDVKINDPVILIGHSGSFKITVEDWACWKNTIPYEIICSFGPRIKKVYLK